MQQVLERPFRFDVESILLAVNGQSDVACGCGQWLRFVLFYDVGFELFEGTALGSTVRT